MKKYILLTIVLALSFSFTIDAQNNAKRIYSLSDIIKETIENNILIKQKSDELKAARFRIDQQKSFYLPTVGAEASYTLIGPIPAFSFGGQNLELAPANNYNMGIYIHQTLYDFGKRDLQTDLVSSQTSSIEDSRQLIKNELSAQAVRSFYSILFLENSIAVKDTQLASLKEHLRTIELKIKNGTATDYDVLSTKTRMIEIQNEQADLKNEKYKQEIVLKELINMDRKNELKIAGDFSLPRSPLNQDSLEAAAFKNRNEIKIAADYKNSAAIQKDLIAHLDKPVISGDAGYGFKNGYEPNIDVLRGNWFFKFSLGLPVFNGYLTDNRLNEAAINIDMADKKIQQLKENISTEVYQSENDLRSNLAKVNIIKEQIDLASKSLERARIQYERGAGTNLEVLDAETMLTQARLFLLQAEFKSLVSFYSLHRAVGDLNTLFKY